MTPVRRTLFFVRVVFLILAVFCLRAAVMEYKARLACQEMIRWPHTTAIVRSGTSIWARTSWGSKRFCPKMEYTYSVDSKTYTTINELSDFGCHPDGYDFVAANRPGTEITIAYNPQQPTKTFIPEDSVVPSWPFVDLAIGILSLGLLAADMVRAWRVEDDDAYELVDEPEQTSILGLK